MLPEIKKSGFSEFFKQQNRFRDSEFENWIFLPGMNFDSSDKWWGDFGKRPTRHEGVDFCLCRDRQGRVFNVHAGAVVPVMFDGVVVAVIPDLLGYSVVVRHDFAGFSAKTLCTIYAHTVVRPGLDVGMRLYEGDVAATVAEPKVSGSEISPHLHISAGFLKNGVSYDRLNWGDISRRKQIELIDPMLLL